MAYFSPDGDMALQTMSSIIEQGNPNATWFPDPASLHSLPWAGGDSSCVAEVFGVPYQKTNGILQPMAIASRAAALKQIRRLNDRGWIIKTGAEMEFRLLGAGNVPIVSVGDYAGQLTFAEVEEVFFYFQKNLLEAGVHIETMHTEADPGQFEFTFRPEPGIKTADGVIIFKHALKEMASKKGMRASFFGKGRPNEAGNSMDSTISLWDEKAEKNIFFDGSQSDNLSSICHHWIAGLVRHADALVALCLLTVNCYRSLHKFWSPNHANWGIDNRKSSFRVKNVGEKGTYIENRLPTAMSNPYLVMAATLAAGLDGVEKEMVCPDPMSVDAKLLPTTMEEALSALDADVTMRETVGEGLIEGFKGLKKELELPKFQHHDVNVFDEAHILAEKLMYDRLL